MVAANIKAGPKPKTYLVEKDGSGHKGHHSIHFSSDEDYQAVVTPGAPGGNNTMISLAATVGPRTPVVPGGSVTTGSPGAPPGPVPDAGDSGAPGGNNTMIGLA